MNMYCGERMADFHTETQLDVTYLAKPVLTMESRMCSLHPLASALYAHSAGPTSYGEPVYATPFSEIRSSAGIAASADSDFQTV
jgi:hypothetical protein